MGWVQGQLCNYDKFRVSGSVDHLMSEPTLKPGVMEREIGKQMLLETKWTIFYQKHEYLYTGKISRC